MAISDRSVLCVYRYDPLDRLADCLAAGQGSARFFYQKNRLATQIQGQIQHSLLRTDEHLLAQRRTENNQSDSALLLTDQQQSVIAAQGLALAYTPYGHRHPSAGPMNLPGFTGQRVDPVTGHYLLGNGYRAFNPVLMRFNSPDSLSPFGEGGLNAYGYCGGDPVNGVDPSGHLPKWFKNVFSIGSSHRRLSIGDISPPPPPIVNRHSAQSGSLSQLSPSSPPPSSGVNDMQLRSASPPPYTPRERTAPLPSRPPPPYDLLQPGERVPLRPPRYTPVASPESYMPPFGAYANDPASTTAATRPRPRPAPSAADRVRGAVQDIRNRGVWD
ncbi:RHS repeat-associated core domain-containing protein [Pseudomonas syringae group genomosp. 3]|uniref:RHS repeat-associated core domain-containing protein n=1 Tax=Pseudomonas syringae group genomosp. 3 TaxID=251701 RepID=UPI0009C023CB|nr:RHS repeat-associated core domain-containing protein [Pseudomonas syringae group genomosp. 3]